MTLIELVITIGLMAVVFVAVLAAFQLVEKAVGTTSNDAQLASRARAVEDFIQSETVAYFSCEPTSGADYDSALQTAIAPGGKLPWPAAATYTAHVVAVAQATGGTHTVTGASQPLVALHSCSTPGVADYGVQQIKIQVSTPQHSLTRVIYKRWN